MPKPNTENIDDGIDTDNHPAGCPDGAPGGTCTDQSALSPEVPEVNEAASQKYDTEVCVPPIRDTGPFDRDDHWDELQDKRFDDVLGQNGIDIWADEAGSGKTTNAGIAAMDRDVAHAIYFDKHEKGREYVTDNALPLNAEDFHLKGGEQKRMGPCMDVDHADKDCPEHGDTGQCPSMCPVYDLDPDHEIRQKYEALVSEVGPNKAHQILNLNDMSEHSWHGGRCAWERQFRQLKSATNVIGVHPHTLQNSVQEGRLNIIDESPNLQARNRTFDLNDLTRMKKTLDAIDEMSELARFAQDIIDIVTDPNSPDSMETLHPPIPESGWYIWPDTKQRFPAETLARWKVKYGETVINRIQEGSWEGAPVSIDPLLAAAAKAGLPDQHVLNAIAIPPTFESCPWCRSGTKREAGLLFNRFCSNTDCTWNEISDNMDYHYTIAKANGEKARATAWITTDHNDTQNGLGYRELPLPSELPDSNNTLILDATASPRKIASLFNVNRDDVRVTGDESFEIPNLRVKQVLDGQYHASTIQKTESLQKKIQQAIDAAGTLHDRPLFVLKDDLISLFDFPDNGDVLHYHAVRGLNRVECDAVMCIGAPHPNVEDLRRDAELLAMGQNDVRVGGKECSTRPDAPNPPVYRKLNYEDDKGRGRAVPTKHYTGLVGDLFREAREKELKHAVHRVRPLLADEPIDVYLLTNVPTDLPVDVVCSFDELVNPHQMLPAPEGAIELLEVVKDVATGDGPDGFHAETLVDIEDGSIEGTVGDFHRLTQLSDSDSLQVTDRTVRNWINDLEDLGLMERQEYEQHGGWVYAVNLATWKSALSVLSYNGDFQVEAFRRFSALAEQSDGSSDWVEQAHEEVGLDDEHYEREQT